jgi:Carboxypeptidase regulatory-like domain
MAGALVLICFSSGVAQSVQGRVIDEETGVPIAGAVVVLLDQDSSQVRAALTSALGAFRLRDVEPGVYRLRAEMIGRQSVVSTRFRPVDEVDHQLRLPARPIELRGLDVTGEPRCTIEPEAARSIYVVWAEIEKALRATGLTQSSQVHRFRIAEYELLRRRRSLDILERSVSEVDVVGGREPFRSLPPAEIERLGYVQQVDDDIWIYGPSIEILLSREFQDTHCFSLRRDEARPGLLALDFRLVKGRRVPDIQGSLWIDEESAELRTLAFEFENVPWNLVVGDYSGSASFRRLDDGAWIINRWWMRSPDPQHLGRLLERGGEVVDVGRGAERD